MNKTYIDDITLIRLFVTGRANLAANENLKVQTALDTHQLLARNGEILAIARPKADPPEIGIRPQSHYAELLDKLLKAHSFLPLSSEPSKGFKRYSYYLAPEGYQLRCTSARYLWREWWIRYRQQRSRGVQIDLLFLTQQKWYPVRNIIFSNSTLFVTTYRGETAHQGDDSVVWAEKMADECDEPTQLLTADQVQRSATRTHVSESTQDSPQQRPQARSRLSKPMPTRKLRYRKTGLTTNFPQAGKTPVCYQGVCR